ncbi:hypothetical protein [Streptomyces silvisoli]|uniref:Uncharacterized protein n=1 Tax=Streptomyces silvisoli TaxID=3034235 RepID=A0ABT5ZHB9_9ACTN|nr:hypothetical protein [Streptomyces silvisoli]MDF3288398.1 hypothetical protein [Streptomyces silvisoli]
MSEWAWEYFPDAHEVIGDTPNLALIAQIEERADELVRAAAVEYPDGTAYQGHSPGQREEIVPNGMFEYLTIVRHERIYITQITGY